MANEKSFSNFKIHSQFSICEGAIKIDELADYCKLNKIKSLAENFYEKISIYRKI